MKNLKHMIYADNSATSALDPSALKAMLPFLQENFGNPSSLHSYGKIAKKSLLKAREIIAESIGALPEEIFFTSGGTESNNWALKHTKSTRILFSSVEHHALINSCMALNKLGYKVKKLSVNTYGQVDPDNFIRFVNKGDFVSIMTANNEIGSINDIALLARITKEAGGIFHTDAVQAIGHIPINVRDLDIDMMSASAHKFNGPKGIGFLFIKKGVKIGKFMDGGQQEFGLRAGTENIPAIVGMSVALQNNCLKMGEVSKKLFSMAQNFQDIVRQAIPNAVFNGNPNRHLPGHISLSIPNVSGESLLHLLDLRGIAVATGAACNSRSTKVSHVLKSINLSKELSMGTIRISFGSNNACDDATIVANEIISIYQKCTSL